MPLSPCHATQYPRINRHQRGVLFPCPYRRIKEKQEKLNPDYYTYDEITEKYGLARLISATMSANATSSGSSKEAGQWCSFEFEKVYIEHRDGTYTPRNGKGMRPAEETFVILKAITHPNKLQRPIRWTGKPFASCAVKTTFLKSVMVGSTITSNCQLTDSLPYQAADNIKEWIGAEQMEEISGMSKDARCSFVHRHKIPSVSFMAKSVFKRPYRHHQKRWLRPRKGITA